MLHISKPVLLQQTGYGFTYVSNSVCNFHMSSYSSIFMWLWKWSKHLNLNLNSISVCRRQHATFNSNI